MTLTKEKIDDIKMSALLNGERPDAGTIAILCDLALKGLAVEWRPIEEAPRDGRVIWLWNKHAEPGHEPQQLYWSTHYSIFGLGGCWTDGFCTMGDRVDFDWWTEALPADPKSKPPALTTLGEPKP